jgi:hypothetical protein
MSGLDSNLQCPACQAALTPKVLECESCHLSVEGPFHWNEFVTLPPEDLHFIRIFIRCEGRIRDMEPALGLSYPTIRSRLTDLKNKLAGPAEEAERQAAARAKRKTQQSESVADILAQLERKEITFEDAMERIKKAKNT